VALNRQTDLENFAAELTEAAFPVALKHGVTSNWLDKKLDLWRAMTRTVREWERLVSLPRVN
jgi:hypothetical protein